MKTTTALIGFYSGKGTDVRGRRLDGIILAWDDVHLEDSHDYIQWLFPLKEVSQFNPDAPLLTYEDIKAFKTDSVLKANLRQSFNRMLVFYGFKTIGTRIDRALDFPEKSARWLTKHNHNFLRITRILTCLNTLGLKDEAVAFLQILEDVYKENSKVIGKTTLEYWRGAV